MNNNKPPLFMHDKSTKQVLIETIKAIPKGTRAYIVGGTVRNAVYHKLFRKKFPQRDFDLVLIGNMHKFISNLKKLGFTYGNIKRKNQVVLKKEKRKNAKLIQDYVVLDISFYKKNKNTTIKKILKEKINFTINGFALELKNINKNNWHKKNNKTENSNQRSEKQATKA